MQVELKAQVLEAVKNVPLLSPSVSKLLSLTSDPGFSLEEFTNVVSHDAMLTAKIIKTVNSAAYNLPVEVDSVEGAVGMLGSRLIVGIALSSAGDGMMTKALSGYESHDQGVWRHNLYCAIAARRIGKKSKTEFKADTAFTGGLLHDIGKTVMSRFLTGSSSTLLASLDRGSAQNYLVGERNFVGIDHAEVGYELAKSWKLPAVLQNIIRYHHNPGQAPDYCKVVCYAVHIGDILSMMAGHGTGADAMQYQLDPAFADYFSLNESDLGALLFACNEEYQEVEASMASVMGA